MTKPRIIQSNKPGPFIDIHCHILPGYDDGAMDMPTAHSMLIMAQTDGVETLVATPHFIPGNNVFSLEKAKALHGELTDLAQKNGIQVEILLGQEILAEGLLMEPLKTGQCLTLAGTRHLLLELPLKETDLDYHLFHVVALVDAGWVPILAHLERYTAFRDVEEALDAFIDIGCLIQVNAGSITGLFGKSLQKRTIWLLDHAKVHVVASDAHTDNRRSPVLSGAYNIVEGRYGTHAARTLFFENPRHILKDEPVTTLQPYMKPAGSLLRAFGHKVSCLYAH